MPDYEFDCGPVVTLVNRTSKSLEMRFNGRSFVFKPGKNLTNAVYADRAKRTFPRMGTVDLMHPEVFEHLVGVEEWGDDCSPIEQSDAIESFDRSKLPADRQQVDVIPTRNLIPTEDRAGRLPLPVDAGFGIKTA